MFYCLPPLIKYPTFGIRNHFKVIPVLAYLAKILRGILPNTSSDIIYAYASNILIHKYAIKSIAGHASKLATNSTTYILQIHTSIHY